MSDDIWSKAVAAVTLDEAVSMRARITRLEGALRGMIGWHMPSDIYRRMGFDPKMAQAALDAATAALKEGDT